MHMSSILCPRSLSLSRLLGPLGLGVGPPLSRLGDNVHFEQIIKLAKGLAHRFRKRSSEARFFLLNPDPPSSALGSSFQVVGNIPALLSTCHHARGAIALRKGRQALLAVEKASAETRIILFVRSNSHHLMSGVLLFDVAPMNFAGSSANLSVGPRPTPLAAVKQRSRRLIGMMLLDVITD